MHAATPHILATAESWDQLVSKPWCAGDTLCVSPLWAASWRLQGHHSQHQQRVKTVQLLSALLTCVTPYPPCHSSGSMSCCPGRLPPTPTHGDLPQPPPPQHPPQLLSSWLICCCCCSILGVFLVVLERFFCRSVPSSSHRGSLFLFVLKGPSGMSPENPAPRALWQPAHSTSADSSPA